MTTLDNRYVTKADLKDALDSLEGRMDEGFKRMDEGFKTLTAGIKRLDDYIMGGQNPGANT